MEINALLAHCTALVHHALALSTTSFYCRHTGEFLCDYTNVRFLPPHDQFMIVAMVFQLREEQPDVPVEQHHQTAQFLAGMMDSDNSEYGSLAQLLADWEATPDQTALLAELWKMHDGPSAKPDFKAIHYDYTLPAWEWSVLPFYRAVSDFIPQLPPRQADKPADHQIDPAARKWDKTHTRSDGTIVRSVEDTRFELNLENPFAHIPHWRWNKGQPYRSGDPRPKTPLITERDVKETT